VAEDELAREILSKVTDLQAYTAEVEGELAAAERESVPEIVGAAGAYAELYRELGRCDQTLGMFESLLGGFQEQLLSLNSDIKALQEASVASNVKIANRCAALERLSRFAGELRLPRGMAAALARLPVGDAAFAEQLTRLNRKLAFLTAATDTQPPPRACTDAAPKLHELREATVARLHMHLLRTVSAATAGGTTVSADIGLLRRLQAELLSTAHLYQFLFKHSRERANEVCNRYVEVASSFYDMYCRRYAHALAKFALDRGKAAGDLLGSPEPRPPKLRSLLVFSALGDGASTSGGNGGNAGEPQPLNVFSLGSRYAVLEQIDSPPITVPSSSDTEGPGSGKGAAAAAAAAAVPMKVTYEFVWRSVVRVMSELAAPEKLFVQDFFLAQPEVGVRVFRKASQAMVDMLHKHLQNSRDCVGAAIMLCVSERYGTDAANEEGHALRDFHARCIKLLVSRMEAIVAMHAESLRTATVDTLGQPPSAVAPHFVTRRFAELAASLLTVAGPGQVRPGESKAWLLRGGKPLEKADAAVAAALRMLRRETERLLQRLSQSFPDAEKRTLFLLNNYDLVLRVLRERAVETGEIADRFRDLRQTAMQSYRDSQLVAVPCFRGLAAYIGEIKPLLQEGDSQTLASHPRFTRDAIEGVLRDFAQGWRPGVERIRSSVVTSFASLDTGGLVLAQTLEHLFSNYKQLLVIIKERFPDLRHSRFFVAETEILYEMQKIKDVC